MIDGSRRQQHPLPPVLALDPGRGLVRGHHLAGAHFRCNGLRARGERGLRAGQQVGDRALAEANPEHFLQQPRQPFEADRLGDVQVHDQRHEIAAEGRPRRHVGGRRGAEPAAAMRASAAMPVNADDDRPNRRQLEMIIGMKPGLTGRAQLMRAMRATLGDTLDNPVRIGGQRPKHPGPALALTRRAAFGAVGFAPLRRRQRGIVRGLGRLTGFGFQFSDAPGQRLDLRRLRQHQRDQLILGELRELILIHPQVESREYTLVNQNLRADRLTPTICAPHPYRSVHHPAPDAPGVSNYPRRSSA